MTTHYTLIISFSLLCIALTASVTFSAFATVSPTLPPDTPPDNSGNIDILFLLTIIISVGTVVGFGFQGLRWILKRMNIAREKDQSKLEAKLNSIESKILNLVKSETSKIESHMVDATSDISEKIKSEREIINTRMQVHNEGLKDVKVATNGLGQNIQRISDKVTEVVVELKSHDGRLEKHELILKQLDDFFKRLENEVDDIKRQ
jgi:hypothetical protein